MAGVRAAILNDRGAILLVRHGYSRKDWNVPGGGIEQAESPIATVEREMREETGLTVVARSLIGLYALPDIDNLTAFFHCDVVGSIQPPWQPNDEVSELGSFRLDTLPEPMHPAVRRCIADAFQPKRGLVRVLHADGTLVTNLPAES